MPRLDLPSGNWIEYRDQLMAADKFAVQDALTLTVNSGNSQVVSGGIANQMRNALLRQIITGWSYGAPIPSMNGGGDIGHTFNLDDYNAVEEAVQPLLDKVSFVPNREQPSN